MIKKQFTSIILSVLILFSSTLTSCLGGFYAFNGLKDWNLSVSDNKFINNFIFWILYIIPVYQIFIFADLIIFNLLEFWTGDNPVGMNEGDVDSRLLTYKGVDYKMTATKNKLSLHTASGEFVSALIFDEESKTWSLNKDGKMQKIVSFDNIKGAAIDYKVYNGNCEGGEAFSVNTNALKPDTEYVRF